MGFTLFLSTEKRRNTALKQCMVRLFSGIVGTIYIVKACSSQRRTVHREHGSKQIWVQFRLHILRTCFTTMCLYVCEVPFSRCSAFCVNGAWRCEMFLRSPKSAKKRTQEKKENSNLKFKVTGVWPEHSSISTKTIVFGQETIQKAAHLFVLFPLI